MKYEGMTVNERLYSSGLSNKFDKAVARKNIERVKEILKEVELAESAILDVLETLRLLDKKE